MASIMRLYWVGSILIDFTTTNPLIYSRRGQTPEPFFLAKRKKMNFFHFISFFCPQPRSSVQCYIVEGRKQSDLFPTTQTN